MSSPQYQRGVTYGASNTSSAVTLSAAGLLSVNSTDALQTVLNVTATNGWGNSSLIPLTFSIAAATGVAPAFALAYVSGTGISMDTSGAITGSVSSAYPGALQVPLAAFNTNSNGQGTLVYTAALPTGFALDGSTGVLSASALTAAATAAFTVTASNASGNAGTVGISVSLMPKGAAVPVGPLTGIVTTLSGYPYGNGKYTLTTNIASDSNLNQLFDNVLTTNSWAAAPGFASYSWNGAQYFPGTSNRGVCATIRLPMSIGLSSFTVVANSLNLAPTAFFMYGSVDGSSSSWTLLYTWIDSNQFTSSLTQSCTVNSIVPYSYYCLFVTRIYAPGTYLFRMNELRLYS